MWAYLSLGRWISLTIFYRAANVLAVSVIIQTLVSPWYFTVAGVLQGLRGSIGVG